MAQPESPRNSSTIPASRPGGEPVYRHADNAEGKEPSPSLPSETPRSRVREIAPAITPLVIGFTLLLALISILGYKSVQRMAEVSNLVLSLEQQHTARLKLLLSFAMR